jgi:hypothetical protein
VTNAILRRKAKAQIVGTPVLRITDPQPALAISPDYARYHLVRLEGIRSKRTIRRGRRSIKAWTIGPVVAGAPLYRGPGSDANYGRTTRRASFGF